RRLHAERRRSRVHRSWCCGRNRLGEAPGPPSWLPRPGHRPPLVGVPARAYPSTPALPPPPVAGDQPHRLRRLRIRPASLSRLAHPPSQPLACRRGRGRGGCQWAIPGRTLPRRTQVRAGGGDLRARTRVVRDRDRTDRSLLARCACPTRCAGLAPPVFEPWLRPPPGPSLVSRP